MRAAWRAARERAPTVSLLSGCGAEGRGATAWAAWRFVRERAWSLTPRGHRQSSRRCRRPALPSATAPYHSCPSRGRRTRRSRSRSQMGRPTRRSSRESTRAPLEKGRHATPLREPRPRLPAQSRGARAALLLTRDVRCWWLRRSALGLTQCPSHRLPNDSQLRVPVRRGRRSDDLRVRAPGGGAGARRGSQAAHARWKRLLATPQRGRRAVSQLGALLARPAHIPTRRIGRGLAEARGSSESHLALRKAVRKADTGLIGRSMSGRVTNHS